MKHLSIPATLLLFAVSVLCAAEVEIKFVVREDNNPAAWQKLAALKDVKHKQERVCFFETETPSLGGAPANLILRARQKEGETGDSTVKVRSETDALPSGEVEKRIVAEEDWSDAVKPNISRSLDWEPLPAGTFEQVMGGKAKAETLFQGPRQQALIKERNKDLDWNLVRRYGPLTAKVWKKKYHLSDAFPEVTVEDWLLERKGANRGVLELSIKLEDVAPASVQPKAEEFFKAVQGAGFGLPEDTSKTKLVIKFYKPGN